MHFRHARLLVLALLCCSAQSGAAELIALRARVNGRYVGVQGTGERDLVNGADSIGLSEKFEKVEVAEGRFALRALVNQKFVVAVGSEFRLIAGANDVDLWARFQVVSNEDGSLSLRAQGNDRYVRASVDGQISLTAAGIDIGAAEKFDVMHVSPEEVADPVDWATREGWDEYGQIPVRVSYLSTPSYVNLSTSKLWTHVDACGGLAMVAVKPATINRGFFRGEVLLSPGEIADAKSYLLHTYPRMRAISDEDPRADPPVLTNGKALPVFTAQFDSASTLDLVRRDRRVDFIEPLCLQFMDSLACGFDAYVPSSLPGAIDGQRFVGGSPDLVPYTYPHHSRSV